MTKKEEFESGERMAEVRIWNWISLHHIHGARSKVLLARNELKPGIPCIDGMLKAFNDFLQRHAPVSKSENTP